MTEKKSVNSTLGFSFFPVISFLGINKHGKVELVSLEPKDEKCSLPSFEHKLGPDFLISNLDEEIHLYDGLFAIYKLSKTNFKWQQTAKLKTKLEMHGNSQFGNCKCLLSPHF